MTYALGVVAGTALLALARWWRHRTPRPLEPMSREWLLQKSHHRVDPS